MLDTSLFRWSYDTWTALAERHRWLQWAARWGVSAASLTLGILTLIVFRRGADYFPWILGYLILLWVGGVVFAHIRQAGSLARITAAATFAQPTFRVTSDQGWNAPAEYAQFRWTVKRDAPDGIQCPGGSSVASITISPETVASVDASSRSNGVSQRLSQTP